MRILAIETSCDETAISIVEASGEAAAPVFTVHSQVVSSQAALHAAFGGVVPNLARREHQKNLVPVLQAALTEANLLITETSNPEFTDLKTTLERESDLAEILLKFLPTIKPPAIDLIAVTVGPGLEPALWVGINFAKALGQAWNIPVCGVNHLAGHFVSPILKGRPIQFPALGLIISGGHTLLTVAQNYGHYETIGQTRDDAVGEAFDKTARLLGLPYPGGPALSALATEPSAVKVDLPRPMINSADYDFSFSGLKTAVRYIIEKNELTPEFKIAVAREFENAVVETLLAKTKRALTNYQIKTLVIGGGVIANSRLRAAFANLNQDFPGLAILIPDQDLTGDNATMIAAAAYLADPNTEPLPLVAHGHLPL